MDRAGVITSVAGTGEQSCSQAKYGGALSFPQTLAVDAVGNVLYIADHRNHRVLRVDPKGGVTAVAGPAG